MAKKILIVDDEEVILKLLKAMLEKNGRYEVCTESRGLNAMSAIYSFKPDLILLDVMMPDMDGSELANQIRSDSQTAQIPIIFMTGLVTKEELKASGGMIGAYPYIAKPVTEDELFAQVAKYAGE
jgi:CheY-like chemotaxis protein